MPPAPHGVQAGHDTVMHCLQDATTPAHAGAGIIGTLPEHDVQSLEASEGIYPSVPAQPTINDAPALAQDAHGAAHAEIAAQDAVEPADNNEETDSHSGHDMDFVSGNSAPHDKAHPPDSAAELMQTSASKNADNEAARLEERLREEITLRKQRVRSMAVKQRQPPIPEGTRCSSARNRCMVPLCA